MSSRKIDIGYVHCFADDYLTTVHFLLKQAQNNNTDIDVFTYTLPIIIILYCFLESNINNIAYFFIHQKHNADKNIIKEIWNDFNIEKLSTLDKYYYLAKYLTNENIRSNNKYRKVKKIIQVRNELIHDKTYPILLKSDKRNIICELLEGEKEIKPNHNLTGCVPDWLPYLEYNSVCWMTQSIFDFYLYYSNLILPQEEPTYKKKIENIISWHPVIKF